MTQKEEIWNIFKMKDFTYTSNFFNVVNAYKKIH